MSVDTDKTDQLDIIAAQIACELARSGAAVDCCEQTEIPNYESVGRLVDDLKQVLFPGYQQASIHSEQDLIVYLSHQLKGQLQAITRQIKQSLILDRRFAESSDSNHVPATAGHDELHEIANQLALKFFEQLPSIRAVLATDIKAAFDGDPACQNVDEVILCYPGLSAITVYRLAHQLHQMKVPFLPRMMSEWVHGKTGIDIHPGAKIGNHFFIDHGTGVVVGATCEIGNHVKIYQGVTLGALSFPQDERGNLVRNIKRHPTIQDNVVIYANATVLGGTTVVGHDSVIGSSVWLTSSVDPFTTVIMEKPKLRMRSSTPSEFEPPIDYQI